MRLNIMTYVLISAIYFYYLSAITFYWTLIVNHYISEEYLFVVAQNVSFLKRFAGL
jgi:hypothetical protein